MGRNSTARPAGPSAERFHPVSKFGVSPHFVPPGPTFLPLNRTVRSRKWPDVAGTNRPQKVRTFACDSRCTRPQCLFLQNSPRDWSCTTNLRPIFFKPQNNMKEATKSLPGSENVRARVRVRAHQGATTAVPVPGSDPEPGAEEVGQLLQLAAESRVRYGVALIVNIPAVTACRIVKLSDERSPVPFQ